MHRTRASRKRIGYRSPVSTFFASRRRPPKRTSERLQTAKTKRLRQLCHPLNESAHRTNRFLCGAAVVPVVIVAALILSSTSEMDSAPFCLATHCTWQRIALVTLRRSLPACRLAMLPSPLIELETSPLPRTNDCTARIPIASFVPTARAHDNGPKRMQKPVPRKRFTNNGDPPFF